MQVPYAESLGLLFLALSLYLVLTRQYLTALPVVLLSDLSRPIGSAFALFVGLHLLYYAVPTVPGQWRSFAGWVRRWKESTPGQWLSMVALVLVSAVGAVAWLLIAEFVTGEPGAYLETEAAWRFGDLVYFLPWLDTADILLGPVVGPLVLVLVLLGTVLVFFTRAVGKLGVDMRLYCASYLLYLLAVLSPWTSTFRLLLPAFPLALAAMNVSKSRAYRWTLICSSAALAVVWVVWLWSFQELPGGGDYPP